MVTPTLAAVTGAGLGQYGDPFEHVRRRGLVVSTMREPSYEGGGDA